METKDDSIEELFADVDPDAALPRAPTRPQQGRLTVKAEKFAALRGLPCFKQIHEKITSAESVPSIARWLQDDLAALPDLTRGALERLLHRYRESLNPGSLVAVPLSASSLAGSVVRKAHAALDEVTEYKRLYMLQLGRIKRELRKEEDPEGGTFNPALTQDIRVASELLDKSLKAKALGGFFAPPPPPEEPKEDAPPVHGRADVEVAMSRPESRRRILNTVDLLLSHLGAEGGMVARMVKKETTITTAMEVHLDPPAPEEPSKP